MVRLSSWKKCLVYLFNVSIKPWRIVAVIQLIACDNHVYTQVGL